MKKIVLVLGLFVFGCGGLTSSKQPQEEVAIGGAGGELPEAQEECRCAWVCDDKNAMGGGPYVPCEFYCVLVCGDNM